MKDSEFIKKLKMIHSEMKSFTKDLENCSYQKEAEQLHKKYAKLRKLMNELKNIYQYYEEDETNNSNTECD